RARTATTGGMESSHCYPSLGASLGLDEISNGSSSARGDWSSQTPRHCRVDTTSIDTEVLVNDQMKPDPNYHVLLIGIDAYSVKPLYGCVNDIDAIQRLLLDKRVAIPKESITRLASPHPGSTHEATVNTQPATLANICSALEYLGSNEVKEGDRVFV